jgi:hypothetical protein
MTSTQESDQICLAMKTGDISIFESAKSAGSKVSETDVITTIKNGHISLARHIIQTVQDLIFSESIIYAAIADNNTDILELIRRKIKITDDTYIIAAVRMGSVNVVKYLIDHGANVHAKNDKCMYLTRKYGNLKLVKLLKFYCPIYRYNHRALIAACEHSHLKIVKNLVPPESHLKFSNLSAIQAATRHGHYNIVNYLCTIGAS